MGASSVISDSAFTQALGVIALGGVVVLTGTNLQVQEPVDYLAKRIVYPHYASPTRLLPAVATKITMPKLDPDAIGLASVRSDSRWHKYVFQRIEELRAAKYDFTDLKVPSAHVVDRAWGVASTFFKPDTPTPSVVPSEDGDVLFVWHKAGLELEIEVGSEEIVLWAHNRRAGTVFSGSLAEQWAKFSSLLDYMARH